MKPSLMPALLALAIAGCTSSQPPAFTPAMAPPAPTPVADTAGFPSPAACTPGTACVLPAQSDRCRTVGAVTTCDVPPDPLADTTTYTN